MSLLTDILGDLFLLTIGLSAIIGGLSAFMKANHLYGGENTETLEAKRNGMVTKAFIIAVLAGIVWYDSFNLDSAVIRVAVPLGIYKFVQLVLTPLFGWYVESKAPPSSEEQKSNG